MSRPKHPKTDANQASIVKELIKVGMFVIDLSSLGGKALDLLVGWKRKWILVEVKTPKEAKELTKGERETLEIARSMGLPAIVATCAEDVINAKEWNGSA